MPRKKKPLSDILGFKGEEPDVIDIDVVEPSPRPMLHAPASIPFPEGIDKEAEDIENARKMRYELIASGQEILRDLMAFAVESEAPRAYEVLTSHLANMNAMVQSMTDLAQKSQKEKKVEPAGTTNNIMFVGTNQELQKMIKSMNDSE